jgi:hypothetical protein
LAVAGLGALHGLSPATGWMFAAARGVRAGDVGQVRRTLLPIALGHAASIGIVLGALARGIVMDRALVQCAAGAVLLVAAACRWRPAGATRIANRHAVGIHAPVGQVGIALWSCLMATAHGAGLMLVPALVPLCMADTPAREITASGSLLLALSAVGVHLAAMLAATGLVATGVCRVVATRRLKGVRLRHAWTVALAVTGVSLIVLR